MGFLGIVSLFIWIVVLMVTLTMEEFEKKQIVWWVGTFVIGLALLVWDIGSPVTIEEYTIRTTDYSKYGFEIESEEILSICRITEDPERFGAIIGDKTSYKLILDK